jgi:hypothetical protein
MSQFEYIMVLLSIVLGLGITHMMFGVGTLVYRLSGHGPTVRLDWIHLTWVGFIFVWLVGFWWWEYSWRTVEDWGLVLYLFLVLYAVGLFLLCVILFPHRTDEVADFRSYFMKVRGWFFGLLIILTGIDVTEAVLKGGGLPRATWNDVLGSFRKPGCGEHHCLTNYEPGNARLDGGFSFPFRAAPVADNVPAPQLLTRPQRRP